MQIWKKKKICPYPRHEKRIEGVEVQLLSFVMSELDWSEWLGSVLGRITSGDTATHAYWIGGSVSTTDGQNEFGKRNITRPCQDPNYGSYSTYPGHSMDYAFLALIQYRLTSKLTMQGWQLSSWIHLK